MKKNVKKVENKGVDSSELIIALDELDYDVNSDNVKITLNKETGETHVYEELEVVENVEDDKTQISLEDARKLDSKLEIGDTVHKELMPKNFGRIAAQTAKQVIVQRIREASREIIFNEFSEKKGEIVSGLVQKVDKNIVVLDLGKIEGIMPLKEQIPTETYHVNQKLRACVASVEKGIKGSTQIIVSRANNDFLRKLFELEIPEIYEGLIEIKSVSRDPGKRCKVAVYSPNENIDPVGSCVGQKGIRIQNIINELNGEKIDVIEWHEDPSTFIAEALLPAKVMAVDVREEEKFAQVIVPDDQLSLAIGKSGQNARLAAKLTNWKIDIKSESQFRELLQKMQEEGNEQEKVTEDQNEAKTEVEEIGNVSEAETESTTEE